MPNYSGVWTLEEVYEAVLEGNWTGIPVFELYAWGSDASGTLGNDTLNNDTSSPIQIGERSVPFFETIAAGRNASFGVKSDGTLWSWGSGSNGQTGQGSPTALSSPTQIGALTNWSTVTATVGISGSGFAVKTDGTLWAWGYNNQGQLGQDNSVSTSSPVQVGTNTDWASVSCFINHTVATTTSGEIYSWGNGQSGATGQNTVSDLLSPVQIGSDTDWGSISTGSNNSASVKTDGTLWTWGDNSPNGPLGIGTINDRSSPVQVGALTNWASVSCGQDHMLAIKTDGTLWAWGNGGNGRTGLGTNGDTSSPVQVGALTDWAKVSAGEEFSTAVKTDGTLWAWGKGDSGQLGDSAVNLTNNSPINIGSLTTWEDVSAGFEHTLGLISAKTGVS